MIYEEAKEFPKTKIDEEGITWILDEETLTYYPDEKLPLTEEEIKSNLVNEGAARWGIMRYEFLKENMPRTTYKMLMFMDEMLNECIITSTKMYKRIDELIEEYKMSHPVEVDDYMMQININNEAREYAEEVAIKEIIEVKKAYTNFGFDKKEVDKDVR